MVNYISFILGLCFSLLSNGSGIRLNDLQRNFNYTARIVELTDEVDCELHNVCYYDYFADVKVDFNVEGKIVTCSGSVTLAEGDRNVEVDEALVIGSIRGSTLNCDNGYVLKYGSLVRVNN